MQLKKEFVNRQSLEFLEIGAYDKAALCECGPRTERNLALELDALDCLRFFPQVENLILRPGALQQESLAYLKGLPILSLRLDYYSDCIDGDTIHLGQFPKLQYLSSGTQFNFSDLSACPSLRTLVVTQWSEQDLTALQSEGLLALRIMSGKLRSLNGLQNLPSLRSLDLSYQQKLSDVRELASADLESLQLERCNHVDVTALPSLCELRYLSLIGTQRVENLSLLKRFPRLEDVTLDIWVADGDLQPLFEMKSARILQDRRHYSARHRDLSKSRMFHSAYIPPWLEILPEAFSPV